MNDLQQRFSRIYAENLWFEGSGTGSRPRNNLGYVKFLSEFMRLNDVRSVVDLGCGDWQFSRLIDWKGIHYTGIDVVPSVIARNQAAFAREGVTFKCSTDPADIPEADLLISKDCFQHLPNAIVQNYLAILPRKFRRLLITNDDWPDGELNGDTCAGGWRALRLDQPPFSQDCDNLLSWTVISEDPTVRKRTVLIRGQGQGKSFEAAAAEAARPAAGEIPKRIYQTWKVHSPLPGNFDHWSRTLREYNPDYEHVLWDDADNRNFIAQNYPWFLKKYDSYEVEILRVDATRYFSMYHFGGFYCDLDVECLGSLDRYLTGHDVLLGQMGSDPDFEHAVPNAIMASRPRQEFWLYVMYELLRREHPRGRRVEYQTGPAFLKSCVDGWNQPAADRWAKVDAIRALLSPDLAEAAPTRAITVLPPKEWYPLDWNDQIHRMMINQVSNGAGLAHGEAKKVFPFSTLVTYWSHSWEP